jgi:mersacidin/lichenicidin family type 2 lantibiotic
MTPSDIIRAWKDPSYRAGLPATQRAQLPTHPAGAIELPEPTLHAAWPHQGFRVKSGLRGGLMAPTDQGGGCTSAYGDNLWQDDLPRP